MGPGANVINVIGADVGITVKPGAQFSMVDGIINSTGVGMSVLSDAQVTVNNARFNQDQYYSDLSPYYSDLSRGKAAISLRPTNSLIDVDLPFGSQHVTITDAIVSNFETGVSGAGSDYLSNQSFISENIPSEFFMSNSTINDVFAGIQLQYLDRARYRVSGSSITARDLGWSSRNVTHSYLQSLSNRYDVGELAFDYSNLATLWSPRFPQIQRYPDAESTLQFSSNKVLSRGSGSRIVGNGLLILQEQNDIDLRSSEQDRAFGIGVFENRDGYAFSLSVSNTIQLRARASASPTTSQSEFTSSGSDSLTQSRPLRSSWLSVSRLHTAGLFRLASVAALLWATTFSGVLAQTPGVPLRPDAIWYFGNQQTTIDTNFAITTLRFEPNRVHVEPLDSLSPFFFIWANASYVTPDFTLQGNGCALVRDLIDTVEAPLRFAEDGERARVCDPTRTTGGVGHQFILPLGGDTLAYLTELRREAAFQDYYGYVTPGYSVSYLDAAALARGRNVSGGAAVRGALRLLTGDTLLEETATHVPDPRGGWWGIARSAVSDRFQVWHLGRDTAVLLPPQRVGLPGFRRERRATRLAVRPQGDRFAISGTDDGVAIYGFDRVSGQITHLAQVPPSYDPDFVSYRTGTDCAWSACGRYLYVTSIEHVYQFDTDASDVAASAVRLDPIDPDVNDPNEYAGYYEIERGPDCRLYIGWPGGDQTLSVIDYPSRAGLACELKPRAIWLRRWYFAAVPTVPEYALWARDRVARGLAPEIDTAVCDASIAAAPYVDWVVSNAPEPGAGAAGPEARAWRLAPNPVVAGAPLRLLYDGSAGAAGDGDGSLAAALYDLGGRPLWREGLAGAGAGAAGLASSWELPAVPAAGTYVLVVTDAHGAQVAALGFVVQ